MENLWHVIWYQGRFLGVEWHFWKVIGWLGNAVFFSRFMVQWYVTEKRKQVVIPVAFWWLSLTGALLLFAYAFHQRDSVFIFAYAFTWIPYVRNLIIHHRHAGSQVICPACQKRLASEDHYCSACGVALNQGTTHGSTAG